MQISVVIITRNEARRLEPALQSVAELASECIICDSRSSDDTVDLARRYGCRILERDFAGYSDQKNFANAHAGAPWILSLDADERVSRELREEIKSLCDSDPDCAAFSMPRLTRYLGRFIRHSGWYPDRKVRLFRKGRAEWSGEFVHERLVVRGSVRPLRGDLLHDSYADLADHAARINRYSRLAAQGLFSRGARCRWYHVTLAPILRAFRAYVLHVGFMDGFPGLAIAVLSGYGLFLRYALLREMWRESSCGSEKASSASDG
jgi:glycosyltransferase involved in cell wall biosynthesis